MPYVFYLMVTLPMTFSDLTTQITHIFRFWVFIHSFGMGEGKVFKYVGVILWMTNHLQNPDGCWQGHVIHF